MTTEMDKIRKFGAKKDDSNARYKLGKIGSERKRPRETRFVPRGASRETEPRQIY